MMYKIIQIGLVMILVFVSTIQVNAQISIGKRSKIKKTKKKANTDNSEESWVLGILGGVNATRFLPEEFSDISEYQLGYSVGLSYESFFNQSNVGLRGSTKYAIMKEKVTLTSASEYSNYEISSLETTFELIIKTSVVSFNIGPSMVGILKSKILIEDGNGDTRTISDEETGIDKEVLHFGGNMGMSVDMLDNSFRIGVNYYYGFKDLMKFDDPTLSSKRQSLTAFIALLF